MTACSTANAPPPSSTPETDPIVLGVRVHLLQSHEVEALDATLNEADVLALFERVNRVWDQADITWRVESVIREPARNGQYYAGLLRRAVSDPLKVILSVIPKENLSRDQWDVFVVRDLGHIAGGVYISYPDAQIAFVAENGPLGAQDPSGVGPRILAHELGHSLGLRHVSPPAWENLMATGLRGPDRVELTAAQIQTTRQQALRGPFVAGALQADQDRPC